MGSTRLAVRCSSCAWHSNSTRSCPPATRRQHLRSSYTASGCLERTMTNRSTVPASVMQSMAAPRPQPARLRCGDPATPTTFRRRPARSATGTQGADRQAIYNSQSVAHRLRYALAANEAPLARLVSVSVSIIPDHPDTAWAHVRDRVSGRHPARLTPREADRCPETIAERLPRAGVFPAQSGAQ